MGFCRRVLPHNPSDFFNTIDIFWTFELFWTPRFQLRQPKLLGLDDRRQSAPDNHRRALGHAVIEIDNVLVDQPHAARGHGLAD